MRNVGSIAVFFLIVVSTAAAAEQYVSSPGEIAAAARNAHAGDEIVMANGTWKAAVITLEAKGSAAKPITLRAQTPGKVILEDESRISIAGEHIVLSGILFGESSSTKDAIEIGGNENRVTDCAIIAPNRGGKWIHFMAGARRCRLDHCYLEGHAPEDVRLQIEVDREQPNEHRLDHNHFGPRPPLNKNGGETIRVGYSHQSFRNARTLVEYNLFDRCDGEIEIISNKSCENTYCYNTFRNSEGCLTLRHGDRCVVDSNFFFGNGASGKKTGGIRVIGDGHTIINNYFEGISGIAGGVIALTAGIPDSPLAGYWQIKKALIAHNTFVDNPAPCILLDAGIGEKGRTLLPENVTIANNLMIPPRERAKPLITGKEGPHFQWIGNLAEQGAELGSAAAQSIETVELKMLRGEDGVWRPEADSPVRGAAKGDVSIDHDIDGQPRPPSGGDVGCDQQSDAKVLNRPLTAADVGPSWRKHD